jgi:acyl-homoserine lactone acylase PvdQ
LLQDDWPCCHDGEGNSHPQGPRGDIFNEQKKLVARGGQCVTSVVLLTDPPVVRSVVAYGQSNNPASPHFADQAPLYSEERFRAVPWTMEQLKPFIESTRQYQYPN